MDLLKDRLPAGCALAGTVPYERIVDLLGNARVGLDVHPWPDPHLEVALPVKVCEYMAAGCAVVSSSMPVLDSLLKTARAEAASLSLIQGGEPEDYARAALQWLEAIEAGAEPGQKLRSLAERHMNFVSEADKLGKLYGDLLGRAG